MCDVCNEINILNLVNCIYIYISGIRKGIIFYFICKYSKLFNIFKITCNYVV